MSSAMNGPLRVRMAPSPTGDVHVGSARTALINYLIARKVGGSFVLRIEDTDAERSDVGKEVGIYDGLRWLGLDWDEGPDVGGTYGPYRQSERHAIHREAVDTLLEAGHAYYDYTTAEERAAEREAQRAQGQTQRYSGLGREFSSAQLSERRAAGIVPAVRYRSEPQPVSFEDLVLGKISVGAEDIDDFVIARGDGSALYNMAAAVDDHRMAISHVVRGKDHISNTFRQILLYGALEWTPPAFAHLPLVVNGRRQKFSKRDGAQWLGDYRAQGYVPEAMLNFLVFLGWAPGDEREIFSLDELVAEFTLERVNRADAVFDPQRLDYFNGVWIRGFGLEELVKRVLPYVALEGLDVDSDDREFFTAALALEQERLTHLNKISGLMEFFFDDSLDPDMRQAKFTKHSAEDTANALDRVIACVRGVDVFEDAVLEAALRELADELGWKAGDLFMPIRIGVTGRRATPPLFETMGVLGRVRCCTRLRRAVANLRQL